jgi:uncharacterized protein involved in outer membrane biogenesis
VDFSLVGGPIVLPDTEITSIALRVSAKDGAARLELGPTSIGKGTLRLKAELNTLPSGVRAALDLSLNEVNLNSFLSSNRGTIRGGTVSGELHLTTEGRSEAALVGGLNGSLHLAIDDGIISLTTVIGKLGGAFGTCPAWVRNAAAVAEITAVNGIVTLSRLDVKSSNVHVMAEGNSDLLKRRVMIHFDGTPEGCVHPSLAEGPWNNLEVALVRP